VGHNAAIRHATAATSFAATDFQSSTEDHFVPRAAVSGLRAKALAKSGFKGCQTAHW